MQLIEVSLTSVRSAEITLQRAGTPLRFVLFPMLHLGSESFYREVTKRLGQCQIIVAEGVSKHAIAARAMTLAYRLPGRRRRLGLTQQNIDPASAGVPVVRPDMTAGQFRQGWRSVPALQQIAVYGLVPVVALGFWLVGSRRLLSRYLVAEDLPDLADGLAREHAPDLTELVVDKRDALLLAALDAIHAERSAEPIAVAVLYGARHMPAVAHQLLARYGYRPRAAEWLTVFEF
jgi:hypothetical protein